MNGDLLIEEGVVVSSETGFASVMVKRNSHCDECSAKIICRNGSDDNNIVKTTDKFGVAPGDVVQIKIHSHDLLKSSFLLYGLPLILIVISIIICMFFLPENKWKEIYASAFSFILLAVYYFILKKVSVMLVKTSLPEIHRVYRS